MRAVRRRTVEGAIVCSLLLFCGGPAGGAAGDAPPPAVGPSAGGYPGKVASLEARSVDLLKRNDFGGALHAAREGLSALDRWRMSAIRQPAWDGSRPEAETLWKELAAMFPSGESAGEFHSEGGRFLAAAALADAVREAGDGIGKLHRDAASTRDRLLLLRNSVREDRRRVEEIRTAFLAAGRKAGGAKARLTPPPSPPSLSGWGARSDPGRARLLEAVDKGLAEAGDRLDLLVKSLEARIRGAWAPPLPPEDRLTVILAQAGLGRVSQRFGALRDRGALLGGKIRERWRATYAERVSSLRESAERAAADAAAGAKKAEAVAAALDAADRELESLTMTVDAVPRRLAARADLLARGRSEARRAGWRALSAARDALSRAVARKEGNLRYLAARAATEWWIEGAGFPAGDNAAASPARRGALRDEAIAHWNAALTFAKERCDDGCRRIFGGDEVLYALAQLRYEEEASRRAGRGNRGKEVPDHRDSVALYRRLVAEYPDSPYAESAYYGLAHALQEMEDADDAVAAMEAMLSRHPDGRYADEILLRLGEYAFDDSDFPKAERHYRAIRHGAAPETRAVALVKLGWSRFIQGRPREAVERFLDALLLSRETKGLEDTSREAVRMAARSMLESGQAGEPDRLLARRGAQAFGPPILLEIQGLLDAQNRYGEAVGVADRLAAAYPLSAERLDAEVAAARSLRHMREDEKTHSRGGSLHRHFGPGSAWRDAAGRTGEEIARADSLSEEGLRDATAYFHSRYRERGSGDPAAIRSLYDAYADLFPLHPAAYEVAFRRAWFLFERGWKGEAMDSFEAVARVPGGARGEAAWHMALQCAKDLVSPSDPNGLLEVVRLSGEYERSFPRGDRIGLALLDRSRAQFRLGEFFEAAEAAGRAAGFLEDGKVRRTALRLEGEARFESGDYEGAERAFRSVLAIPRDPDPSEDVRAWIGFSIFRRAESLPPDMAREAAALFYALSREFPSLDIAPTARFRAGTAYEEAGMAAEAVEAFLSVESDASAPSLSADAALRLARIFEGTGRPLQAAERYERLAAGDASPESRRPLLLRAAELYADGIDGPRARRNLVAVASLAGTDPELAASCLFRAAESARSEGKDDEADRRYGETLDALSAGPGDPGGIAGTAHFRRGEFRFRKYLSLPIGPPLEKSYLAKRASLESCLAHYREAVRLGDPETASASLHRIGEAFEAFRSALISSPAPKGLSEREREEYVLLLEEKSAPFEETAVEAYARNVRQGAAAGSSSPWVEMSRGRLMALRPASFGESGESDVAPAPPSDRPAAAEKEVR